MKPVTQPERGPEEEPEPEPVIPSIPIPNEISNLSSNKRAIIFMDVDCFEVQLWLKKLKPELIGKDVPIVAVNLEDIMLSVNYTAKSLGVQRGEGPQALRDARSLCKEKGHDLIKITAGTRFGKVDSFVPQTESDGIVKAIQGYLEVLTKNSGLTITLERSCRDEFYMDVTDFIRSKQQSPNYEKTLKLTSAWKRNPNEKYKGKPVAIMETSMREPLFGPELLNIVDEVYSKNIKYQDEVSLVHAAIIAQNLLKVIKRKTGYDVSAGIAHSKLVAKLACDINKPEGITVISDSALGRLQKEMPFQKLPGFKNRTGSKIRKFYEDATGCKNIISIDELLWASKKTKDFSQAFLELQIPKEKKKTPKLLKDLCNFFDESPVKDKVHQNNFSCSMPFKDSKGKAINIYEKIRNLSQDMEARIEYNRKSERRATELVVKVDTVGFEDGHPGNVGKKLFLQTETSSLVIEYHIWNYLKNNKIDLTVIMKIYLTASRIVECEKEEQPHMENELQVFETDLDSDSKKSLKNGLGVFGRASTLSHGTVWIITTLVFLFVGSLVLFTCDISAVHVNYSDYASEIELLYQNNRFGLFLSLGFLVFIFGLFAVTYKILSSKAFWRDPRIIRRDSRTPWRDSRTPWRDSRTPWRDSRTPWRDSRTHWWDYITPWRVFSFLWQGCWVLVWFFKLCFKGLRHFCFILRYLARPFFKVKHKKQQTRRKPRTNNY